MIILSPAGAGPSKLFRNKTGQLTRVKLSFRTRGKNLNWHILFQEKQCGDCFLLVILTPVTTGALYTTLPGPGESYIITGWHLSKNVFTHRLCIY